MQFCGKIFCTEFCHDFATKLLCLFINSDEMQGNKKTCKSLILQVLHVFLWVFEKYGKV